MDPIISAQPSTNGNKLVTVYDDNKYMGQTYSLPATQADEFISSRNQKIKQTKQNIGVLSAVLAVIGGIGSYCLNKNVKGSEKLWKTALGALGGTAIGTLCIGPFMLYSTESKTNNEFIKSNMK